MSRTQFTGSVPHALNSTALHIRRSGGRCPRGHPGAPEAKGPPELKMFTTQEIIIGAGLLVLAWAVITALMYRGGHVKRVPDKRPRKR